MRERREESGRVEERGRQAEFRRRKEECGEEGKIPGTMAGPTCCVQPWPELGDVWALEGTAPGVAFNGTLGRFPVWISHRGERKPPVSTSSQQVAWLDPAPAPLSPSRGLSLPQTYEN